MATEIKLELGEVQYLPERKHSATTPLVARTDESTGSGEELLVLTPGKKGLKLIPYGSLFHGYEPLTETPIFETPEGVLTDWHENNSEEETPPHVDATPEDFVEDK